MAESPSESRAKCDDERVRAAAPPPPIISRPVIAVPDSAALAKRALGGDLSAEYALMARAGQGDITSQRLVLDSLLTVPFDRSDQSTLGMCEMIARLIATRGDDNDAIRFAGVLAIVADVSRREGRETRAVAQEAECLMVLETIADRGSEAASETLNTLAPEFSKEGVRLAASARRNRRTVSEGTE